MIAVGQTVEVYQDPLTQKDHEGKAIVRSILNVGDDMTRCEVEFVDEPDGGLYTRAIANE